MRNNKKDPVLKSTQAQLKYKYSPEQIRLAIDSLHKGTHHHLLNPTKKNGVLWNNFFRFQIANIAIAKTLKRLPNHAHKEYMQELLNLKNGTQTEQDIRQDDNEPGNGSNTK